MMTFNNKFKNRLCTKKVIKILFLNLLRQNSKVYSQASRFDVQRKLSAPLGGLIKKKQSLNILVVHKTVVLVIVENVLTSGLF